MYVNPRAGELQCMWARLSLRCYIINGYFDRMNGYFDRMNGYIDRMNGYFDRMTDISIA